ncbi:MAG: hypothetical protein R3F49_03425 [Planctomycetota bacterium]
MRSIATPHRARRLVGALTLIPLLVTLQGPVWGQSKEGPKGRPTGPLEVHEPPASAGIAWFGTWDAALAEAERTGRPMLFMSAAPQCQNVPGVW